MLKYRWSLPSFLRLVLRRNIGSSRMPEISGRKKGAGLHSVVFRKSALQTIHLRRANPQSGPRSAKVRLGQLVRLRAKTTAIFDEETDECAGDESGRRGVLARNRSARRRCSMLSGGPWPAMARPSKR